MVGTKLELGTFQPPDSEAFLGVQVAHCEDCTNIDTQLFSLPSSNSVTTVCPENDPHVLIDNQQQRAQSTHMISMIGARPRRPLYAEHVPLEFTSVRLLTSHLLKASP